MARKKTTDVVAPEAPAETPVEQPPEPPRNGEAKNRPIASWSVNTDRTTRLECSLWSNLHKTKEGEEYEQITVTLTRSYKTDQGWVKQDRPSFRVHDLPLVLYLVQKAQNYGYERRTTDNAPF